MFKAFRQSFAVKCTSRANAFLFALKQIPLIKKLIPLEAYSARGIKAFAMVVIALWEISITFLTKAFYLGLVLAFTGLISELYDDPSHKAQIFLHMLLFLTATGGIINSKFFDSSKLGYNTVNLLRMDAKQYTLSSFFYHQLRFLIGWMPFSLLFGRLCKVPVWICLLLPFAVVGSKLIGARIALFTEKRFGVVPDDKKATLWLIIYLTLMFCAAAGALLLLLGRNALISSEGGIFDTLAGIYTKNVNIDVMLKGYSGDPIRVDRIGRESENISNPALTVLLMAQPNVVSTVLGAIVPSRLAKLLMR